MSEAAILDVVKKNFQDHLILGEEGGIIGDSSSDYLWCIDPLGIAYRSPIHGVTALEHAIYLLLKHCEFWMILSLLKLLKTLIVSSSD